MLLYDIKARLIHFPEVEIIAIGMHIGKALSAA